MPKSNSEDESSSGSMLIVGLAAAVIVVVVVVMVINGGKTQNNNNNNNTDKVEADEDLSLRAVRIPTTETTTANETLSATVRYDSDNDDNENENDNEENENAQIDALVSAPVRVADQANGAGAAPDQMCNRATECPGRGARSHFHEILSNGKWSKRDELDGKKKGIVTGAPLQRARYTLQEPTMRVTDFHKEFHGRNKNVVWELYHNELEKSDKLMARLLRAQKNFVPTNEAAISIAMGPHESWD